MPTSPAPTLGTLYLVPTPLDFACEPLVPLDEVLPDATLRQAARLTHWVCENAKSCRATLKRIDALHPLAAPLQQQDIRELPRAVHKKGDHGGPQSAHADTANLLAPLRQGHDVGLMSEAGMPAVADPGSSLVRAAHDMGAPVVPLVGPVSLLLALAASGLNGQNFAFVGYLPTAPDARAQRIHALDKLARSSGQTQLFIETPYRNAALWQALLQHLPANTRLAVAAGLSLPQAQLHSRTVSHWRQLQAPAPDKHTPAVYAIGP